MGLFPRLWELTHPCRNEVFEKVKNALDLHTKLEEEILCQALEDIYGMRELVKNFYKDHRSVDKILEKMDKETGDWEDNLSELVESVRQHISEEENELFPKAEKAFSDPLCIPTQNAV